MQRCFLAVTMFVVLSPCGLTEAMTLSAIDRGWYEDTGHHHGPNTNTFTGQGGVNVGRAEFRSFFVFDLSGASPAADAVLKLELEKYASQDSSETFHIFDVSATAAELATTFPNTGSPVGQAIYDDLGSGSMYANGTTVVHADEGSVLCIQLNAQAVSDINAALGGTFAVGVALQEPYTLPRGQEGIRFSESFEPAIHQLVLTPVPEPSSLAAVTALTVVGLCFGRRRRRIRT